MKLYVQERYRYAARLAESSVLVSEIPGAVLRRHVGSALMIFLLIALSGCLAPLERRLVFPGAGMSRAASEDLPAGIEEVWLDVGDHVTHGWYAAVAGQRGVALFSHGNGSQLSGELDAITGLQAFGLSVLAYDYGGYGASTGRASESRCYEDIRAMWEYLTVGRLIPPEEIILVGRSLGSGPTLDLAVEVEPAAVVLEGAFLSVPDVARATSWKPAAGLVRHRFDNKNKVGTVTCPVLIVHSPADDVVPFVHGEQLFALAPEPKQFLQVDGGHNFSDVAMDPAYGDGWKTFLETVFGPDASRPGRVTSNASSPELTWRPGKPDTSG